MNEENIEYLPLDVVVATVQVRKEFSEESLRGLMESLLAVGQLVPIRVRKEGDLYVIVEGERRYRAAKMAGSFTTMAAIVEGQDLAPSAVQHRQIVANCQREGLTVMETAIAIRELMQATGWTAAQVASQLGMSQANVSKALALTELPPEIQAKVEAGEIPASAGYDLSRIEDHAQQTALATQVASGRLTRDALTGIVRSNGAGKKETTGGQVKRIRADLSGGRSVTVSGAGLDTPETLIAWLEELLGKVRKLRPKGLDLTTIVRIFRQEAKN
ncbi:MAG: ParB/RepB/Spo0J family partition protein [Thermoguttaceae bacterium]|jgi:ParB family chromosome partitioning protein